MGYLYEYALRLGSFASEYLVIDSEGSTHIPVPALTLLAHEPTLKFPRVNGSAGPVVTIRILEKVGQLARSVFILV